MTFPCWCDVDVTMMLMFWCWPTVCRQSADSLPTVCRQYDDVDVTMMFRMLADCRPTVCRHHDDVFNKNINVNVTSLSVCVNSKTCSSLFVSGCVGRQSADSRWRNEHVHFSTDCLPTFCGIIKETRNITLKWRHCFMYVIHTRRPWCWRWRWRDDDVDVFVLADSRPTVCRQSADSLPTVGRQSADSRPTF